MTVQEPQKHSLSNSYLGHLEVVWIVECEIALDQNREMHLIRWAYRYGSYNYNGLFIYTLFNFTYFKELDSHKPLNMTGLKICKNKSEYLIGVI